MPEIGVSMDEGTLARWLKQPGDPVSAGESIAEIETDKAAVEIESPVDGVLGRHLVAEGDLASVGAALVRVLENGESEERAGRRRRRRRAGCRRRRRGPGRSARRAGRRACGTDRQRTPAPPPDPARAAHRPRARHPLRGHRRRRAAPGDVLAYLESAAAAPPSVAAAAAAPEPATAPVAAADSSFRRPHRRQGERGLADDPALHRHPRGRLRGAAGARPPGASGRASPRPSPTCCWSRWRRPSRPAAPSPAIGLAVAGDRGVTIPVIHDVLGLGLVPLAEARAKAVERGRSGRLEPADLASPPASTLSNLGPFGVDQFTGVIASGQPTLLTVGRIRDRVVVRGRAFEARPTMFATLNVDHRALDGADAAKLLDRFATAVERPEGWERTRDRHGHDARPRTSASTSRACPRGELTEWLSMMMLIRRFEERAERLGSRGAIPGGIHSAAGQEATAVGVDARAAARRRRRRHPPHAPPRARQGPAGERGDGRAVRQGHRVGRRPRRHDAPGRPQPPLHGRQRHRRRRRRPGDGRRAGPPAQGRRRRGRRLRRRRRPQRRPHLGGREPGRDLVAPADHRLREQHVRRRDPLRPGARRRLGGAPGRGLRARRRERRRPGRGRGLPGGHAAAAERAQERWRAELRRVPHLPLRGPQHRPDHHLPHRRRGRRVAPQAIRSTASRRPSPTPASSARATSPRSTRPRSRRSTRPSRSPSPPRFPTPRPPPPTSPPCPRTPGRAA